MRVKSITEAHWLFMAIGLFFGFIFVIITPPLWGLDEPSHFERVYQIATGSVFPDRNSKSTYGGQSPVSLVALGNYAIADLIDNNEKENVGIRKDINDNDAYQRLTTAKFSNDEEHVPQVSSYSPVAYIGSVIGVMLANIVDANIGTTLFLARIFSLLIYVLLGWCALRLLRSYKLKWLFMLVLLLPTAIFEASVVSADGMLIGLSVLLIALFIKLVDSKPYEDNKKLFYALLFTAILIPLVKANYIFLSALVLFVPNTVFSTRKLTIIIKSIGMIVTALLAAIWSSLIKVTGDAPTSLRPDGLAVLPSSQLPFILNHPLHFIAASMRTVVNYGSSYVSDAIALIGWNYIKAPLVIMFIICLGIVFASLYAKKELISLKKIFLPLSLLVFVGIIGTFVALYLVFTPVGGRLVEGLQGRYFLPFVLPLLIMAAAYIPIDVKIKDKAALCIFVIIPIFALMVTAGKFYLATY